jgi:hypothetical protein
MYEAHLHNCLRRDNISLPVYIQNHSITYTPSLPPFCARISSLICFVSYGRIIEHVCSYILGFCLDVKDGETQSGVSVKLAGA